MVCGSKIIQENLGDVNIPGLEKVEKDKFGCVCVYANEDNILAKNNEIYAMNCMKFFFFLCISYGKVIDFLHFLY